MRRPPAGGVGAPAGRGRVRIIGGRWRGRRIEVADAPDLRPTPDRVRETLFNWLQPVLPASRCLDAYAGTGALGFEAASRGAGAVVMVERSRQLAQRLREVAERFGAGPGVAVECADVLEWLARPPSRRFDVVFLDPPFAAPDWSALFAALPQWLAPGAWIHVEASVDATVPVPADWRLHRSGHTREIAYALYRAGAGPADTLPLTPGTAEDRRPE